MTTQKVVNTGLTILHLYDKGSYTFVVFRFNGRTYERKADYDFGMYHFTFKRQLWSCYARRLYS